MANSIEILLRAIDQVTGPVNAIAKNVERSGNAMSSAFSGLNKIAGIFGITVSAIAVGAFFKQSTEAAIESERAQARLSQTVDQLGLSYSSQKSRIDQAIQSVSKYALVQDEEVSDVLQKLILQTGDLDKSIGSLSGVYDLARAANIDADSAARMYTQGLAGNIEALSRFFPALRKVNEGLGENATASQKAAAFQDFMTARVSGAAQAMGPAEKAIREYTLAWEEFKEGVGTILLPVLTEFLQTINSLAKIGQVGPSSLSPAMEFMMTGGVGGKKLGILETNRLLGIQGESVRSVATDYDLLSARLAKFGISSDYVTKGITDQEKKTEKLRTTLGQYQEQLGMNIALEEQRNQVFLDTSFALSQLSETNAAAQEAMASFLDIGPVDVWAEEFVIALSDAFETAGFAAETFSETMAIGIGDAVAQSIVYGKNFRDTMTAFFKQWAAAAIAEIIRVIVQMLILRALGGLFSFGFGAAAGAGGVAGAGAGAGGTATMIAFHSGGIIGRRAHSGLAPDEIPIIAQTGEAVLNRRATASIGSSGVRALNSGRGIGSPSIGQMTIQFPNVTSFQDWMNASPEMVMEVTRRKIIPALESLGRQNIFTPTG